MDVETKRAFTDVRTDIRGVEQRLAEVDARLTEVDARLTNEADKLRREIRDEGTTTRRHFDVVAESLRDDIRLIAEGVVALDAKVEAMRRV